MFTSLAQSQVLSSESNKVFSIERCLELAKKNNLDLKTTKASLDVAHARMRESFGSYLPSFNGSMGYSRHLNTNDADYTIPGVGPNSFNMGISAGWKIFDGFGREANYQINENNLEAAEYNIENSEDMLIYQVYYSYINVIRNSQIVKIRRENIKTGRSELEMIKARYEAGMIPIADVYSQEADLGNRESQLIIAENNLDISKAMLLTLMGLDPTINAVFPESSLANEISENDISKFYSSTGTFRRAVDKAFDERADYQSKKLGVSSAEEGIKVAYSAYSPSLGADFSWNWSDYEFSNVGEGSNAYAGVTLRVPIFNNFRTNTAVQNAKLQLTMEEVAQEKLELSIKQELQKSFLNLKAAEKMLEVTDKSKISAQQNYESMKERFKLGAASITEMNYANMQYITAQINRIDAIYSYQAAQKEVLYNMGIIK